MSDPRIILFAGPPAVGKSSVSRALAQRFAKLIHIEVDQIRESVISGYLMPNPEWPPEVMEQINLARFCAIDTAKRYADAGFNVVIDDFADGRALEAYSVFMQQPGVQGWVLYPGLEVTLARCHSRGGQLEQLLEGAIRYCYTEQRELIDDQLKSDGWQFLEDPSQTPEQIADSIFRQSLDSNA